MKWEERERVKGEGERYRPGVCSSSWTRYSTRGRRLAAVAANLQQKGWGILKFAATGGWGDGAADSGKEGMRKTRRPGGSRSR